MRLISAVEDAMNTKRTTIYLDEKDRQALTTLQARYGMATLSDVIRFALRTLAAQPEREGSFQETPFQGLPLNNEAQLLQHLNEAQLQHLALTEPVPWPISRDAIVIPGSPDEDVAFLNEKLQGTQEELAVVHEELTRTQEELNFTTQELQSLNQRMLEMSAERDYRPPPRPSLISMEKTLAEMRAMTLANKQRLERLLMENTPLRSEIRRLVRQAREEVARLRQTCVLS